uniref:hypothetical protein n=1 Tax=Prevotella sp. TaxID=59823 RepID=UPI004026D5E5
MRIKVYHLLFLLLLFSFAIPARGQEPEKLNQKLQTKIEALRADAASLQAQLMEWTTKVSASAKQLEVLTRSITMRDVRKLRETVDSLKQKHLSMEDSIQAFDVQIRKAKDTIQALEGKLEGMKVYSDTLNKEQKQRQMQELLAQNNDYLNLRFSKMSMERLKAMKDSLHEFAGQKGFDPYKERLAFAINYKRARDKAWACVDRGEGLDSVASLRLDFFMPLRESVGLRAKMTQEQFMEMDSLNVKLSRIAGGIRNLRDIVEITKGKIVKLPESESKGKECLKVIRYYRDEVERSAKYQRYFEVIPFLRELLEEYWKELEEDPLKTQTKAEEIIDQLVVA